MKKALLLIKGLEPLGVALAKQLIKNNIEAELMLDDPSYLTKDSLVKNVKEFDIASDTCISSLDFTNNDITLLFLVIGVFLEKKLVEVTDEEIKYLNDVHYTNPIKLLRKFYRQNTQPCHLIVIGSCSAWRLQHQQSIYSSIRAAQAALTRNLVQELVTDIPGSKISLINLAGIKTPEFNNKNFGSDDQFMDTNVVAETVIENVKLQTTVYRELQIMRKKPIEPGSMPLIMSEPCAPEIYIKDCQERAHGCN